MRHHELRTTALATRPLAWRALAAGTLVVSTAYLAWRLTTLGSGWSLLVSVPLLVAEATAAIHVGLLVFQTWTAAAPAPTGGRPRTTEIVVNAAGADQSAVESTLVGCVVLDQPAIVHIVDDRHRAHLHRMAHDRGIGYSSGSTAVHAVTDRISRSDAELLLLLDAGAVPMPSLLHDIAPHFDDSAVAVVQVAIDLLNADSLAHATRGRDEQALERQVIGPSTGARGMGPWVGTGSIVRQSAIADIGGIDPTDESPRQQALVRLHRAGWKSSFEPRPLVRAPAPDHLDEYLAARRRRTLEGLCLLGSTDSPLPGHRLAGATRLAHLARSLMPGAGLRQLVYVAVLAITLLTGRLPFTADVWVIAMLWAAVAGAQSVTRHRLADGTMARGDWLRQGWRTVGADVEAIARRLGWRSADTDRDSRGQGWGSLGHLRLLTGAIVALELALLARAATLFDADLLPAFSGIERVMVLVLGVGALVPMVDVLHLHVRRTQRRRDPRRVARLPITIAGRPTETIDITPRGVGVAVDHAPPVGSDVEVELTIPRPDGSTGRIVGVGVVRAATARAEGDIRLGIELTGLETTATEALIRYCAIDHALLNDSDTPLPQRCPGDLEVDQSDTGRLALRVLTAAAVGLALVTTGFGPTASPASAAETKAVVCLSDSSDDPIAGAAVARRTAGSWTQMGTTGPDGCIEAAVPTGTDTFRVTFQGVSAVRTQDIVVDPIVAFETRATSVAVRHTDGTPVIGVAVRRFVDGWQPLGSTDAAGGVTFEQLPAAMDYEVTVDGIRFVESRPGDADPTVVITMARLVADPGVGVLALDGGAGWRPFVAGLEVLPGRYTFRLAGGGVAKLEVPARHQVSVPSGAQVELIAEIVDTAPTTTVAPVDTTSTSTTTLAPTTTTAPVPTPP
ncbi:MAG: glycosyltransferase, partial [Acidimicrobiia bacterium]|nr:glycosyltransferase [Acidimicrobiia bacterium]